VFPAGGADPDPARLFSIWRPHARSVAALTAIGAAGHAERVSRSIAD